MENISLRAATTADLPILFEQQRDPEATCMAAFTASDPSDWAAFEAHESAVLANDGVRFLVILANGQIAGSMVVYIAAGQPEVGYWLGKSFWGKGIATRALALTLATYTERPLYARAAKDNAASRRVLEKCGFRIYGEDRGYASARGREVEECLFRLDADRA